MEPSDELRFRVDRTAGKLARWLRILGFDVEYVATCDPVEISKVARQSARRTVTRNRDLAERLGGDALLLASDHLKEQLVQVLREAGAAGCRPFSRCNVCNARLVGVEKRLVEGRVPRYVYENHDEFAVCPVCGRYFWKGTHWRNMVAEIQQLMEGK